MAKTWPVGRMTAFISVLGCDIFGPYFHAGVDAPRSITSVLCVDGFPPPMMNTRGSYVLVGVSASNTEVPYLRVPLYLVVATLLQAFVDGSKSRDCVEDPE